MSNFSELTSIDSADLALVNGGAEGNWERRLGRAGDAIGAGAGGLLGNAVAGPLGGIAAGYAGMELGGGYGRQLGRAIDNPQPGPTGGVNGGNGPEQMSP